MSVVEFENVKARVVELSGANHLIQQRVTIEEVVTDLLQGLFFVDILELGVAKRRILVSLEVRRRMMDQII